jgi:hypothetical protein
MDNDEGNFRVSCKHLVRAPEAFPYGDVGSRWVDFRSFNDAQNRYPFILFIKKAISQVTVHIGLCKTNVMHKRDLFV